MRIVKKKVLYLEKKEKNAILKKLVDKDLNIKSLSELMGFSNTYIYTVLSGEKPFTDAFKHKLESVLKGKGDETRGETK